MSLEHPPVIELRQVSKIYGSGQAEVAALRGIDLSIERGDFVAVMGPSGSGKSTCMNILGCLDSPTSGSYRFDGVEVGRLSRDQRARLRRNYLGFVFQGFLLLGRSTALENVELPLVYRGLSAGERHRRAAAALERVGLSGWATHRPNELSGGQRQRVAVARALVGTPSILLADEPTGNLDSKTTEDILGLFDELHGTGNTIVLVTHEPDVAHRAERVVVLRDGRIASDTLNTELVTP
jgi:putative ABC transport system ATP-binding protein